MYQSFRSHIHSLLVLIYFWKYIPLIYHIYEILRYNFKKQNIEKHKLKNTERQEAAIYTRILIPIFLYSYLIFFD